MNAPGTPCPVQSITSTNRLSFAKRSAKSQKIISADEMQRFPSRYGYALTAVAQGLHVGQHGRLDAAGVLNAFQNQSLAFSSSWFYTNRACWAFSQFWPEGVWLHLRLFRPSTIG
jgi:hypothetical protein